MKRNGVEDRRNRFRIGYRDDGSEVSIDISETPHLIVGGGAKGHSADRLVQELVRSLTTTRTPEQLQLLLVDSGRKALSRFEGDSHLVAPIISQTKRAVFALYWVLAELERRMKLFASVSVRTYDEFNARPAQPLKKADIPRSLPRLIVVVSESQELLEKVGAVAVRDLALLAQKSSVAGIHLVLATEHPSAASIPRKIRDSVPCRIAFSGLDKRAMRWVLGNTEKDGRLNGRNVCDAFVRCGESPVFGVKLESPSVRKSLHVDARIHAAAKERLAAAGWDDIDFAVEYFLAECVVRKRLPAFLNWEKQRTCAVCKFYEEFRVTEMKNRKT